MWIPQAAYQLLVDQLAEKSSRIVALEQSLELERHENRLAERHWANSLLRAKAAYPLTKEPPPVVKPALAELVPAHDPGEREALIAAAAAAGLEDPAREADRILREERGGF
jgi:hypothetical protein